MTFSKNLLLSAATAALCVCSGEAALAQGRTSGQVATTPAATADDANSDGLQDIVVTANKRSERALEVPGAISAFRGDDLLKSGATGIQDLVSSTPGLQFNNGLGSGAPIIRGLSQGIDTSPTVATIVNGAPIGSSSSLALGAQDTLELDPIDFERVEVLKGPQGTLYGANTLGGLISYTMREPNMNTMGATVRGEVSTTRSGDESYSLRGALDIPLTEGTAGLRLSGFYDRRGGFVDNALRNLQDENSSRRWGVHAGFVLHPVDNFKISIEGFHQDVDITAGDVVAYSFATQQPRNGDLRYDEYILPSAKKRLTVAIANIDWDFGFANLTAVSSYQNIDSNNAQNLGTSSLASTLSNTLPLFGGPAFPTPKIVQLNRVSTYEKNTQELRLTSPGDRRFSWILGGYYSYEVNDYSAVVSGRTTVGGVVSTLNPALNITLQSTLKEYSGFINGTFKITPALDITGGVRLGQIDQTYQQALGGSSAAAYNVLLAFAGASPVPALSPLATTTDTVDTYLLTGRYHFSPDGIIFARYSTGFRPGGPNLITPGLPAVFKADQTQNYEGGVKTKFLGGRGSIDITGYYTRWRDITVVVTAGGFSGYTNGGNARTYGVEAALNLRPIPQLTLGATFAYSDGKILDATASAASTLKAGDPLPYSPETSGSLSAEYRTPVFGDWSGYVAASGRFASSRYSAFKSRTSSPVYLMPAYQMGDVHVGLENSRFALDVFVKNVTDERAQLAANSFYSIGEVTVARPRTIGLSLTARY